MIFSGPERIGWISKNGLFDFADQRKPVLYEIARTITIFTTVTVARAYAMYGGDFRIKVDDHYKKLVEKIIDR